MSNLKFKLYRTQCKLLYKEEFAFSRKQMFGCKILKVCHILVMFIRSLDQNRRQSFGAERMFN